MSFEFKNWIIFAFFALLAEPGAFSGELETWGPQETQRAFNSLMQNISPSGTAAGVVIASPSQAAPNYYFHWVRDASLTMDVIATLYRKTPVAADKNVFYTQLMNFAALSRTQQLTPNLSGNPGDTGLGEPKFNVDGSPYLQPWGRPQNDGPALRALTLTHFAQSLLQEGKTDLVRRNLYDGVLPADCVIKADLEYVAHHWADPSFDLWEEVKGNHFYTRMVQRRALIEGALLADEMQDSEAAGFYRQQAQLLAIEIEKHWNSVQQTLVATLAPENQPGCRSKDSGLDVAIILGALHGCAGDGFLCPGSDQVLATAERLRQSFDAIYPINRVAETRAGESVGSAIGRYPEDCYDGVTTSGTAGAWFLATHAYAELYYRAAHEWQALGGFQVTSPKYALIRRAGIPVSLGETITSADPRFAQILAGLQKLGDDELRRSMLHTDPQGSMSEQMNAVNGYMQSARDLSWSYSSFLTAVWAR